MTENIFLKDLQLVLRLFSWKDELRWYLFDHLVHFGKLYHQPRSSKPSDAEGAPGSQATEDEVLWLEIYAGHTVHSSWVIPGLQGQLKDVFIVISKGSMNTHHLVSIFYIFKM